MKKELNELATRVLELCSSRRLTLAVAESLTGGAVANSIVNIPGASAVFRGGAVTYATDSKSRVLGVSKERLALTGPVDELVARQMASGVGQLFDSDIAVATTGVAGPGPADGHEVGTVWIGVWSKFAGSLAFSYQFDGDRDYVRYQTVEATLRCILLNFQSN